jgi:hypothetical protein
MARQPWSEFVRNHPCAHLVVAFLDIDDIGTRRMRAMRDVLVSTIRRLAPSAIYGVTIVRAKGAPEIHLAFADAADAILVSTALEAKVVNQCPGYASQRGFAFDYASAFALRVALPPSALGESQRKSIRESAGMRTDPAVLVFASTSTGVEAERGRSPQGGLIGRKALRDCVRSNRLSWFSHLNRRFEKIRIKAFDSRAQCCGLSLPTAPTTPATPTSAPSCGAS